MNVYNVKNPDPAWPECTALFVYFLLCLTAGLSEMSFGAFMAANWWPFLRITLVVWAFCRLIDLFRGGPRTRAIMRAAYRNVRRSVSGQ